jgi:hypothetical protein
MELITALTVIHTLIADLAWGWHHPVEKVLHLYALGDVITLHGLQKNGREPPWHIVQYDIDQSSNTHRLGYMAQGHQWQLTVSTGLARQRHFQDDVARKMIVSPYRSPAQSQLWHVSVPIVWHRWQMPADVGKQLKEYSPLTRMYYHYWDLLGPSGAISNAFISQATRRETDTVTEMTFLWGRLDESVM